VFADYQVRSPRCIENYDWSTIIFGRPPQRRTGKKKPAQLALWRAF
jgi:hypothetical protein